MAVVWRNLDYWKQIGEDLNYGGNGWKDRILAIFKEGVVGKIEMNIHDFETSQDLSEFQMLGGFHGSFQHDI